jgi:hypothetical protein
MISPGQLKACVSFVLSLSRTHLDARRKQSLAWTSSEVQLLSLNATVPGPPWPLVRVLLSLILRVCIYADDAEPFSKRQHALLSLPRGPQVAYHEWLNEWSEHDCITSFLYLTPYIQLS